MKSGGRFLEVKSGKEGIWLIFGDFNAVRFKEERRGSRFDETSACRKYTWYNKEG